MHHNTSNGAATKKRQETRKELQYHSEIGVQNKSLFWKEKIKSV
jgi:hypothetical protein